MRPFVLAVAIAAALALAPAAIADDTIALVPGGFLPNSVTVRAGERVVFRNDDRVARRVAGDRGSFRSPLLRPGQSFVHRFDDRGSFGFFDSRDRRVRGGVLVLPALERITIAASPARVAGGGIVTLSGRVSNRKPGQQVFVLRRFPGEGRFNISDQLTTGRDGRWSVRVEAVVGARFRAQWSGALSRTVRIGGR